ncbi:MAG TPA: hypothetical protein VKJ00_12800, partial [Thermoanaerobaculia bacterium]|nr:hypothetical protein [Thermoanaerobaculia bacterium]
YLWWVSGQHKGRWPTRRAALAWLGAGVLVFALGHAIFLVTDIGARGGFTMTGKNNRVAVAATLGTALCFVAGAGWLVRLAPARIRGAAFAFLIGLLAAGGFIIDNTIANSWAGAYRKEMEVVAAIQSRFPRLPPHTTLILDGTCPYVGPAVVFKSKWDLAGLLALAYQDPAVQADVVTSQMEVREDGLVTKSLSQNENYPYSDDLLVFDVRSNAVTRFSNTAVARRYFQQRLPLLCPQRENL